MLGSCLSSNWPSSAVQEVTFLTLVVMVLTRILGDVQNLSIIPRPQSPTPLEDRPIESLTFNETKELLRRKKVSGTIEARLSPLKSQIAKEASRVKIKQEKKNANVRELAAIKRSRDEADDDEETIEVTTVLRKRRTKPANVIELD